MNASPIALLISACVFVLSLNSGKALVSPSPHLRYWFRAFLDPSRGSSFDEHPYSRRKTLVQPMLVAAGTKFCWEK